MKKEHMPPVIIESPFRGGSTGIEQRNAIYLDECLYDSLLRGEAPFASHGLYPRVLSDRQPAERALGIEAGHVWMRRAALVAVYADLGISDGMLLGIDAAIRAGKPIAIRTLNGDAPDEMLSAGDKNAIARLILWGKTMQDGNGK